MAPWPLSVQRELKAGARAQPALTANLESAFLGAPVVLEHPVDLLEAELLRLRLAGSSLGHRHNRGEAEAIFLARRLRGVFVSEDRDARILAAAELGADRVVGTPDLLARAVRLGLIRPDGAWEIYRAMLAAGRRLGHVRRDRFGR